MAVNSESPSSRRAWIEIPSFAPAFVRKQSPSSRRAWIEMHPVTPGLPRAKVALLAEGVDRNTVKNVPGAELGRRPPRGGRG